MMKMFMNEWIKQCKYARYQKTWTPTDGILLISSWLKTSKDPVVSNEQKAGTFWKRVAAYFAASPKAAGCEERSANNCKQRWHKINDLVCKFCGAYEAATRKWCKVASAKNEGSSKKRKCEDAADSSASQPSETKRPAGVKASKARGKGTMAEESVTNGFQSMWDIKQKDLEVKDRLSKMSILEALIAKKEPLADYEEALKKKLISQGSVMESSIESGSNQSLEHCVTESSVTESSVEWSNQSLESSVSSIGV
ncbi:hypothetical protein F2Q68_00032830 [Brassica cretica]|uniref:Myb-like domain-containing protein n=1 Tax=Brassica cretica TaxID=69181 RepID=A0A8S9G7S5_BRACR|nr:hypothetical protein F2Q68_00032830 [Brassica cretica]